VIEEYAERGVLTAKDAIELKKLLHAAEEKYKFSIYGGDPSNLANYFNSSDFRDLVNFLKSCQAIEVLTEILRRVREVYVDYPLVLEALNYASIYLSEEKEPSEKVHVEEEQLSVEALASVVKEKLGFRDVTIDKNVIKATLNEEIEFKVGVFKQHVRIEVKFKKTIDKKNLHTLFNKVTDIAEKAVRVRL
jgi:hypothetical protein